MSATIKVLDQQGHSKAKKAAMIGKLLMSLLLNREYFLIGMVLKALED